MDRKRSFFKSLILYLLFWIILAEKLDFQVVIVGIIITAAISLYNLENNEERYTGNCLFQLKKIKLLIYYVMFLVKEIIIASFQVAKIVLARELNISPSVITFKTRLKSDLLKTILANSITLTPGTLTIEVTDDEFTVHCITKDQIHDVIDSKFEDLLLKIEEQ